jgi:DNA-binding CsgD family transcriptional regulator
MSAVNEPASTSLVGTSALSEDAARELTAQIRSAVVRTIDVLGEVDALVARAYEGRAWLALGHASWDAYCTEEFSGARLWASVDERQAATLRLRDAGLSLRAAAAVLGVSDATVRRDELQLREGSGVSTASDVAVDTVAGVDGRSRPARRLPTQETRRRSAEVVAMRSRGCTQVEIAERLGIAQSTVSAYLSAATARGELDPTVLFGIPEREDAAPAEHPADEAPGRSRSGGLLIEATSRAGALATHARSLREVVVDADEWTSDPLLAADAADAVGDPVAQAAGDLVYVLAHLDVQPAFVHTPADARVHVVRSRRVRDVAVALAAGTPPAQVAEDLGVDAAAVAGIARRIAGLPADRRPAGTGGSGGGPGSA